MNSNEPMSKDTWNTLEGHPITTGTFRFHDLFELPKPTHRWSPAQGTWFHTSNPPNALYRFMQRMLLGIRWEKVSS